MTFRSEREKEREAGIKCPLFNEPLLMTSKRGRTARESISRWRPSRWMHLLKPQSTTHNTGINTQTHTRIVPAIIIRHWWERSSEITQWQKSDARPEVARPLISSDHTSKQNVMCLDCTLIWLLPPANPHPLLHFNSKRSRILEIDYDFSFFWGGGGGSLGRQNYSRHTK